jgi:hypothetical protein
MTSLLPGEPMSQRGIAVVMETKLANLCQPIIGPNVVSGSVRVLSLPAGCLMRAPVVGAFCSFAQSCAVRRRTLHSYVFQGGAVDSGLPWV